MILPLSDSPNPQGTPVVTYALIGVNIAIFFLVNLPLGLARPDPADPMLLEYLQMVSDRLPGRVSPQAMEAIYRQTSSYDLFVFEHGFRPAAASVADLFTSLFLHSGFMHLFGNMLFLWIYGDNVEYRLGRLLYLLAYLFTGVAATLFFTLFAAGSQVPLIGASGAISGVLGFYFLWFPRNRVRLWVFLFPFFMDVIQVSARVVLGIYLVVENLLPFLFTSPAAGGVAYGAHIGGFLGGLALAFAGDRRQLRSRPRGYDERPQGGPRELGERVPELVAAGRFTDAASTYFPLASADTRRLLEPAQSLAFADWLASEGHSRAALVVYMRHLRDYPSHPSAAAAHVGAGLVQLRDLDQVAPAYHHFLDALDLDPAPEIESLARDGIREIEGRQKWARSRRRR